MVGVVVVHSNLSMLLLWIYTDIENGVVGRLFPTCDKISIGNAVMEKSNEIYTLPAEFGWSYLGGWGCLRTLLSEDTEGNDTVGNDIRLYDCKKCVVNASDEFMHQMKVK